MSERRQLRTVCPECGGDGVRWVPTLAIVNGRASTRLAPRRCRTCKDQPETGWLPGMQPPV
jgi:hypothetical protein